MSTVGWPVRLPGHALRLTSAVCPVSLFNSFLALSWRRALRPVCTGVCAAVSAAAGVRARGGGPPCPWGSDWSEGGCARERVSTSKDEAAAVGEQVTWPGSKGVSGSLTASPGCERPWVSPVVRARWVGYGTGGAPCGSGGVGRCVPAAGEGLQPRGLLHAGASSWGDWEAGASSWAG